MTRKPLKKASSRHPLAVGTGLVALDAVVSADESMPIRYWAGGTCGNVLIALRYLGWTSQPVARFADDNSTTLLLNDLKRWGVSEKFIRVEHDGSTPIIVHRITRHANGRVDHSYSWRCKSCGARYPGYKPELVTVAETIAPKIKAANVFFFDRASPAALMLAKAAAENGALVAFEPSGIGNPLLFRQAWEVAHLVKYSHERLSDFPELDVESNPHLVIETLGDAGLRYRWRKAGKSLGKWIESKAIAIDGLKDTAGSGDWCTAGILSKLAVSGYRGFSHANDDKVAEAVRFGQALAAWNCQFEGARGGMYAVSKQQFNQQVTELVSGTGKSIPIDGGKKISEGDSTVVCRVCEHSTSASGRKLKRPR